MATGRTFDLYVYVATGNYLIDLTPKAMSADVPGSANITRQAGLQRRYENATFHTATHSISIPSIYVGTETDALSARQGSGDTPWVCIIDDDDELFFAQESLLTGVPENAPTSDVIVTSVTFPQANRMITSDASGSVNSFSLADSAESASISPLAVGDHVLLVVNEFTGDAIDVTVSGLAAQNIGGVGVWSLGEVTTAQATATVSVGSADLTSAETLSGFVLIGKETGK